MEDAWNIVLCPLSALPYAEQDTRASSTTTSKNNKSRSDDMKQEREYQDAFDEEYSISEHPDAKQLRDRRARELRRDGFWVQTETTDTRYSLSAKRKEED